MNVSDLVQGFIIMERLLEYDWMEFLFNILYHTIQQNIDDYAIRMSFLFFAKHCTGVVSPNSSGVAYVCKHSLQRFGHHKDGSREIRIGCGRLDRCPRRPGCDGLAVFHVEIFGSQLLGCHWMSQHFLKLKRHLGCRFKRCGWRIVGGKFTQDIPREWRTSSCYV